MTLLVALVPAVVAIALVALTFRVRSPKPMTRAERDAVAANSRAYR